ncbi:MAG: hypothetical protein HC822_27055, partial [Oscillochloris sp.]|nr:hypothetical protein [Oscillochloris sp.]
MLRVDEFVADASLDGLAPVIVAQQNLVGDGAGETNRCIGADHALEQFQFAVLAGRRWGVEHVLSLAEAVGAKGAAGVRAELDEIIRVRIPQNTKDISIARSYGDLRENFEYKS